MRRCTSWFYPDGAHGSDADAPAGPVRVQHRGDAVLVHGAFGAGKSTLLVNIALTLCELIAANEEALRKAGEEDAAPNGDSGRTTPPDHTGEAEDATNEAAEDAAEDASDPLLGSGAAKRPRVSKSGSRRSRRPSPAKHPRMRILVAAVTNVAVDGVLAVRPRDLQAALLAAVVVLREACLVWLCVMQGLLAAGFTDFARVGSVKRIAKQVHVRAL